MDVLSGTGGNWASKGFSPDSLTEAVCAGILVWVKHVLGSFPRWNFGQPKETGSRIVGLYIQMYQSLSCV